MLKQAFGWMVHVYPFNGDDLKVAFGMAVPKPLANYFGDDFNASSPSRSGKGRG